MNTATQNATVAAPKQSAGDIAIAVAQKPGATVKSLLKAAWSTRGNIRVYPVGFEFGVAIIKSDLTKMLQALPETDPAPFLLIPSADGADLKPVVAEAPAA